MHPKPNRSDSAGKVSRFGTDTLTPLFCPRSVAIVGASDDPARISGRALRYLLDGGFQGEILPVNPMRPAVQGVKAYASIAELPQVPDVAIIAVSSRLTGGAVRECASKGVKAVVLFSAGYAETGDEGAAAQDEMLTDARTSGMRVLGPNCLGLFTLLPGAPDWARSLRVAAKKAMRRVTKPCRGPTPAAFCALRMTFLTSNASPGNSVNRP